LFTQTKGFPHWDLNQIILFQGVLLLTVGLKNTLFGNTKNQFIGLIRNGDFDRFLLKPFSPMELLMATSFTMEGIGTLFAGIAVIIYAGTKINLLVSLWTVTLFLVCIVVGLIFNAALDIIHCSLIILTVADGGVQGIINAYLRFSEYPLEIYPKYIQLLFVTLIPMAIFIYYPAQALLGRVDIKLIYCFVGVIIFFAISLRLWNSVLKKYVSAGG
jgi:ABC-2 type transport system permease protein